MTDQEQKKQLQIDAGIPHLPTDLTYQCRIAIAGEGERGWEWQDKPHRLVYDLCRQVEADADRIEKLVKERDDLGRRLNTARYGQPDFAWSIHEAAMSDLRAKLAKAVEALVAEREANLWNAYNIGIERDGRWSDACMSDAEWLVAQCGLDQEFKDHDANVIKEIIPTAARAVLTELGLKE